MTCIETDASNFEWISVEERLPDPGEYVLWIHENGYVFMEALDDDWDIDYMSYFLGGYGSKEINGRIIAWGVPPICKFESTGSEPMIGNTKFEVVE